MLRRFALLSLVASALLAACSDNQIATPAPNRSDVVAQDLSSIDAPDVTTVGDASDASDASDVADASDATDASDVSDAPDIIEAAVDTGPPPCASDSDCARSPDGPACDTLRGRCVQCRAGNDARCSPSTEYCDVSVGRCVAGCRDDAACEAISPPGAARPVHCDTMQHRCFACYLDSHCPAGNVCTANVCAPGCNETQPCTRGLSCCDGQCVDSNSSLTHCGACGVACASAHGLAGCSVGRCVVATCELGYADCDGDASNGCEVDARTSAANCGSCGNACGAGVACVAGECAVTCSAPEVACGGVCRDVQTDVANCGACDRACAAPNNVCVAGACAYDCRQLGATPCAGGRVCDYTTGACLAVDASCLLTGSFRACGSQSCGPGTYCDPTALRCAPFGACRALVCDPTGRCYGRDCPCERPATCAPATLDQLNTAPMNVGLVSLDIDDECNVYGSTVVGGTDYVRRMDPSGRYSQFDGLSNLDMGEVAVQRGGGGSAPGVAAVYACCARCSCAGSVIQGVGLVDRATGTVPMSVPAEITTGGAGVPGLYFSEGPLGLAIAANGDVFVGNLRASGDFFRIAPSTGTPSLVTSLPRRVHASALLDPRTMLVAVETGELYRVDLAGVTAPERVASLAMGVASMRADFFTGRVYASLSDGRIVSFRADGGDLRTVATLSEVQRIAFSPDGSLYHMAVAAVGTARFARIDVGDLR